jgi:hypothetical protein
MKTLLPSSNARTGFHGGSSPLMAWRIAETQLVEGKAMVDRTSLVGPGVLPHQCDKPILGMVQEIAATDVRSVLSIATW